MGKGRKRKALISRILPASVYSKLLANVLRQPSAPMSRTAGQACDFADYRT